MTDFLMVLMVAGPGDELQGIKRGLLGVADLIAITKADGDNVVRAKQAAAKYEFAMNLLADPEQGIAPVVTCSSLDGTGLEEILKIISERTAERERSGYLHTRRGNEQNINWMWSLVDQQIHDMLHQRPAVDTVARSAAAQVRVGVLSPIMAAETIISALFAEGIAAGTTRDASVLAARLSHTAPTATATTARPSCGPPMARIATIAPAFATAADGRGAA
jgi:LAO/AO transport system kinase